MPVPHMQLEIAYDLTSPSERRAAMLCDVGHLAASILQLPFDAPIPNHTGSCGTQRPLHRLIIQDGDGMIGHQLYGTTDLTSEQREIADAQRLHLEAFYETAVNVVADWKAIVFYLHKLSANRFHEEHICMKTISMGVDGKSKQPLYFAAFDVTPRVCVGNLAHKIHQILIPHVRDWIGRMTAVVREELRLDSFGTRMSAAFDKKTDAELLAIVQDSLVDAICTQISLSAKQPGDSDDATEYVDVGVCTHLLTLIDERIDLRKTAKRSIAICKNNLRFLERVVYSAEADACFPKRERVADVLRDMPFVLRSRPGFRSLWTKMQGHALLEAMNSESEFATRLGRWRANVDECIRLAFSTMLKTAMEITAEQTEFVDSDLFLETNFHCMAVEPPWAYKSEVVHSYVLARAKLSVARKKEDKVSRTKRPYLPLSTNVELALRLVSTIRELCADEETANAYFGAGKVPSGYLRELLVREKIDFAIVEEELETIGHKIGFGINYRNAANKLQQWKGSSREAEVRDAISKVSRWSLADLASVMSDRGPVFETVAPHVLRETTLAVSRGKMREAPSLIQRVLTMALPWLMEVRHELRVAPMAPSSPLLELLGEVSIVREFFKTGTSNRLRSNETELVLAHDDLTGCRGRVEDTLKTLAGQGQLVVHKKRRGKADAEFGNKRVFTLSTQGLLALAQRA
jgi:hypothetical protein